MLYYFRTMTGEMLGHIEDDLSKYGTDGFAKVTNLCVLIPSAEGMNISLLMGEEGVGGFIVYVNLGLVLICHRVKPSTNLWSMYQKALSNSPRNKMVKV